MQIIRFVWDDLRNLRNLDAYITIALGIIFGILGITGNVGLEIANSAVLATLALLALGTLLDRNSRQQVTDSINSLQTTIDTNTPRQSIDHLFLILIVLPDLIHWLMRLKMNYGFCVKLDQRYFDFTSGP